MDLDAALADTQRWLDQAVIGLNLCPFAKAVHSKGQIRWVATPTTQPLELLDTLVKELRHLVATDPAQTDTTLIVALQVLKRFADFNDFLGVADEVLAELGLDGTVQIAAFHPRWVFDGVPARDPANHTNRAPHPTLHLLREASVARAVAAVPDADSIVARNIETLRRLGPAGRKAVWG